MPRLTSRPILLEDLRLCKDPAGLLNLFSLLGYTVEPHVISIPKTEIGFAPADMAAVRAVYLLAEQKNTADFLQIILFELETTALGRLRSLARNFLERGGNYLFVATADSPAAYRRLSFINPRREAGQIKIRKLVVDTVHPTRHDVDILSGLAAKEPDPLRLFQAQCAAFDVERVTGRFYQEYAALFKRTAQALQDNNKGISAFYDPAERNTHTQRLLGRIMFLYFIQKKGWLAGDPRFLTNQYQRAVHNDSNYYLTVLEPLFFDTLNQPRENHASPWGRIPYLNGGLFERDTDRQGRPFSTLLYLPNDLFDPAQAGSVLGFFNNYNFTVAEETPIEQEVAVDPEMLGKVFENMMEEQERGKSGTFYTPRPIVHYMCRQALLGYLQEQTNLPAPLLQSQFDLPDSDDTTQQRLTVSQSRLVERALDHIKLLDPAVGTGAFLVGMLQELVGLKRACHLARGVTVPRSSSEVAGWKRDLIANALYGVDIKRRAIEIARLRLWLSLVVDIPDLDAVEPLPNLDYKLMSGNSLIETFEGEAILPHLPEPSGNPFPAAPQQIGLAGIPTPPMQLQLGMGAAAAARADLAKLKQQFFHAQTSQERRNLRSQIEAQERAVLNEAVSERLADLQSKINTLSAKGALVNWKGLKAEQKQLEQLATKQEKLLQLRAHINAGEPLPFFLPQLHFFEVFRDKGGFDILIANPPYVRQELIKEFKPALQQAYPQVYHGVADLYVYFYARGLNLLRPGGELAFIAPNKFMRANYGQNLRVLLSQHTRLHQIIDFGDLPVFDATTYPCILFTRKENPPTDHEPSVLNINTLDDLQNLETTARQAWPMPQTSFAADGWQLENPQVLRLLQKLRDGGTKLGQLVNGQIYFGIKTAFNEAFVINEVQRQALITADPASAELIKPWLRGRDMKRWRIEWDNLYLISIQNSGDKNAKNPWKMATNEAEARRIFQERYFAIHEHLSSFETPLRKRQDQGRYWWELRACAYYAEFEKSKIIWPDIAKRCEFSFDQDSMYVDATIFLMPTQNLYLLGILNSSITYWFMSLTSSTIQNEFLRFKRVYLEGLPIPEISISEQKNLIGLVEQLLAVHGQGAEVPALEAELNDHVYHLFGLTPAEIRLIEEKTANR